MIAIITILVIAIVVYGALVLATWLTLASDFKYYKSKYQMLPYLEYKITGSGKNFHIKGYDEDGDERFLWFYPDNDFKIGPWNYLHNSAYTFFHPYSWYWYNKYKKYTNEVILPTLEIDLKQIKEY